MSLLFKESHVLCCTETWLSPIIVDSMVNIPAKTIFRRDRASRGGGVCIYVDDSLSPYCNIDTQSSYISPDLEIVSIDLKKPGLKYMKICCIYRPPRGNHKNCIDKLTEILSRRENFKKEIWFLGDFNVDYLKRDDPNQKRFSALFKNFGLTQSILNVTRPGKNYSSCIDWIVTNSRFVQCVNTTNIFISDHYVVECYRKKARENKKNVTRKVRCFKRYDKNILSDLLHARILDSTFDIENDPNVKWEILYNIIYDILSIMCPYKNYTQREVITPWISAEIYRNIRYRESLVNLYKLTKNDLYLTLMKRQRNIVNTMIETAKKKYISELLEQNSSCPKKFWKYINQFLKGEYGNYHYPDFVDPVTGNTVIHGNECNFLNDYFVNISSRLGFGPDIQIDFEGNNYLDMYSDIDDYFDISADLPTVEEIMLYTKDIEVSKSSCIDGISTIVCKDLLIMKPNLLASIFQASLRMNIFPASWARGQVIIIPKAGDLSDPSNWRPITQTPIFAKILEKIVYNRINCYFLDNNILSSYQYGFRQGRSTQQAISDLTKYVYSNLNHKKIIGTICLDVAKAFDCLNHDLLLYKMSKIGFCNNSIAWFKSYLSRTQVLKFDNNVSTELPVQTGIGQGTVLGPILFIFYINDIISVIRTMKINMYADDCILFTSGNDWQKMLEKMQPEIDNIQRWYNNNFRQ